MLVRVELPRQPEVLAFLSQSDDYTRSLYPPESCHLLGVEELEASDVTMFVARENEHAMGMAAIVDRGDSTGELKRMFVPESARGRGIAGTILYTVEQFAAQHGIHLIQLETGPLQLSAIALYERCGYTLISNFGKYAGDPLSVCYEKTIA